MSKAHHCHRGTTLIEGMVYCAIFGIIMTCIYWVLVASMRYYNIANYSVDLQQNGLSVMTALSHDLSESKSSTFTNLIASTPKGVIFASPRNSSGTYSYHPDTRLLMWTKWVCYYIDTTNGVNYLYRKEYYKNTSEAVPVIPDDHSTIQQFKNDSSLPRKTMAKYIQTINATLSGNVVELTLTFDNSPSTDKGNSLSISTKVKMTN
ncbi:MAG: type II secretion system protein J [Candidatus Xenobiia bacterium LiM19]